MRTFPFCFEKHKITEFRSNTTPCWSTPLRATCARSACASVCAPVLPTLGRKGYCGNGPLERHWEAHLQFQEHQTRLATLARLAGTSLLPIERAGRRQRLRGAAPWFSYTSADVTRLMCSRPRRRRVSQIMCTYLGVADKFLTKQPSSTLVGPARHMAFSDSSPFFVVPSSSCGASPRGSWIFAPHQLVAEAVPVMCLMPMRPSTSRIRSSHGAWSRCR